MTKTEQAQFDKLRYEVERLLRRVAQLADERNAAQRVVEILFDEHGIHDEARDAYYRKAKTE